MKIREIDDKHNLDEGIFNTMGNALGSMVPGAIGQRASGRLTQGHVAADLIKNWFKSVGQDPDIAQDAGALQQYMKKASSFLPTVEAPTDMSTEGVKKYITKIAGKNLSASMRNSPDARDWIDRAYADPPEAQQEQPPEQQQQQQEQPPEQQQQQQEPPPEQQQQQQEPPPINDNGRLDSNQVQVGDEVVTRQEDGTWTDEQGDRITNQAEVDRLNSQLQLQNQNRQMGDQSRRRRPPGQQQQTQTQAEPASTTPEPAATATPASTAVSTTTPPAATATPASTAVSTTTPPVSTASTAVATTPNQQASPGIQTIDAPQALPAPATARQQPQIGTNRNDVIDVVARERLPQRALAAPATAPTAANPAVPNTGVRMPTNMQSTARMQTTMQPPSTKPGSGYKPMVKPSTKPAAATAESIDLGEVLWRKMKSRQR